MVKREGQAILFPKASIHWQANLGCDSVMVVVMFNDEDPGTIHTAQGFFRIKEELLSATLGGVYTDTILDIASMIPSSIAEGLKSCRRRCGLE